MESAQRSIVIGASAPGADDGRRHGVSPVPLSAARRAAVGAPRLHAHWRLERLATFLELVLVPVLYAVFVLDLKLVTWEAKVERSYVGSTEGET